MSVTGRQYFPCLGAAGAGMMTFYHPMMNGGPANSITVVVGRRLPGLSYLLWLCVQKMKGSIFLHVLPAIWAMQITYTDGFMVAPMAQAAFMRHHYSTLSMAYELAAEPEGGEEMTSISTMAGSRMKDMGENAGLKSEDGTVNMFWLSATVEGPLVTEIRTTVLKESAKNANFPGFRKGQIPPYAQPQITGFAVQESLIRTVEGAVKAYGLKALAGSDGEVTINEEVKDICKGYKVGEPIAFTATFSATVGTNKSSGEEAQTTKDKTLAEEEISVD